MYDHPAVVALRDHLGHLVATDPAPASQARLEELRQRTRAVVDELKAQNWPPERIIIAVKHIARDAGLWPSGRILSMDDALSERDTMLVNMVRWCIEQYYSVDTPGNLRE